MVVVAFNSYCYCEKLHGAHLVKFAVIWCFIVIVNCFKISPFLNESFTVCMASSYIHSKLLCSLHNKLKCTLLRHLNEVLHCNEKSNSLKFRKM